MNFLLTLFVWSLAVIAAFVIGFWVLVYLAAVILYIALPLIVAFLIIAIPFMILAAIF